MASSLVREVQITKCEFLRQLPDAINHRDFTIEGDTVHIDDEVGTITIELSERADREVGPMQLPMLVIGFTFENMTDEQVRYFMEHYDSHKLRGSGGM